MPHLSMLFQPIYLVNCEAGSFEWDPEQESVLKEVQAVVRVTPPLEPHEPADPVIPKMSVTDRMSYETSGISSRRLMASGNHNHWKAALACSCGLIGPESLAVAIVYLCDPNCLA